MSRRSTPHLSLTRRRFLMNAAAAPILSTSLSRQDLAGGGGDALGLGFIGMGHRGFELWRMVAEEPGVEVVSCGDLWTPHFDRLREFGRSAAMYTPMWIKVLMTGGLDGVVVALPDHLQTRIVEEALRRGKKVYVETPATYRWDEWARLKAQSEANGSASLYWGAQSLSSASAETAGKWLAEGRIGSLLAISGEASGYWGGFSPVPPGATLQQRNWNWFLEDGSEDREFDAHRFFNWGGYSDHSGGVTMRHFQHLLAAIHAARPLSAPSKVSCLGGNHRQEKRWDLPDQVFARIESAEGPAIQLSAAEREGPPRFRVTLQGSEGRIEYSLTSVRHYRESRYLDPAFAWPKRFRTAFAKEVGDGLEDIPAPDSADPGPVEEITVESDGTRRHLSRFLASMREGRTGLVHPAQEISELIGHLARRSLETGSPAAPSDLQATG